MFKKISSLLSFCLVVCLLWGMKVGATNNESLYTEKSTYSVKCGEEIEIPVYVNSNKKLMGLGIDVQYDSKKLQAVSVKADGVLEGEMFEDSIGTKYSNPYRIIWSSSEERTVNGKIAVLVFKAIQGGTANVKISTRLDDTFTGKYERVNLKECSFSVESQCKHSLVLDKVITKATTSKAGSANYKCSKCGAIVEQKLHRPNKISLSSDTFVYGKATNKPSVTVLDEEGQVISKNNYSVNYDKDTRNIGIYKVTVTFKGLSYSGNISTNYTVVPKKCKISKAKVKKKKVLVKWKKDKSVDGYEIQLSVTNSFTKAKSKNVSAKKGSVSIPLKKNKFVRIRSYKVMKSKKIYSEWTNGKKIK